jgi:hypothetical protein
MDVEKQKKKKKPTANGGQRPCIGMFEKKSLTILLYFEHPYAVQVRNVL